MIAAFGHTLGISHHFQAKLLIVVSIIVPAVSAAFHGIGTQRQFCHTELYRRMAELLNAVIKKWPTRAARTRREVAAQTMREENSD